MGDYDNKTEQDIFFETFDEIWPAAEPLTLSEELDNIIYEKVKDALIKFDWNKSKASAAIGLKRTTFIAKCKKFNL
jgi:transcriptional regulator of acetoin/glycerol metabolism